MTVISSERMRAAGLPARPLPVRTLRVAYVVHTFDMGGLERCVARLLTHLDRCRFRPMLVCMTRNGTAAEWIERNEQIPVVELHKGRRNGLLTIRRFAAALQEHQVDIVHSHNWGTLVETSCARRLANVPYHVHAERGTVMGGLQVRGLRRTLRSAAMRWSLQQADAVVSNACAVAHRIGDACGFPSQAVRVIPNGVDVRPPGLDDHHRIAVRRQLRIDDRAVVAGSVGRLVPVKGFSTAVAALALLISAGVDLHLMLVGDGPELETLAHQARLLGLEGRVHFAGWHDDAAAHLAAMDIYLNTSVSEGMSQSIAEAMAMGLPLVVSDVGDSGLVVGGDDPCGLIVPPNDPQALAHALKYLVQNPQHRALYARRARQRQTERFSIATMVRAYEQLYHELAAK